MNNLAFWQTAIRPAQQPVDISIYQDHLRSDKTKYIPGLDGLRAISVILVIVAHAGFSRFVPGNLGVTIFFFISGFLITNLLISEYAKTAHISVLDFYVRRYLRLTPELYFFVLFCIVGSLVFFHVRWIDVLGSLFYFQNYVRIFSPDLAHHTPFNFSHLWSLAIEEHFYLVMPAIYALLKHKWRVMLLVMLAVCAIAPFYRLFALHWIEPFTPPEGSHYSLRATEARIDSIVYGCVLAIASRYFRFEFQSKNFIGWLLIASALTMIVVSIAIRNPSFLYAWSFTLQGLALIIGFIGLYFTPPGRHFVWLLERPVLRMIGRLSYGMYLWHIVPISLARWFNGSGTLLDETGNRVVLCFASLSWAIFAASLSEQFLLRPMRTLRDRFGSSDPRISKP